MEKRLIRTHQDLEVYQKGFEAAMQIFEVTKSFPKLVHMINNPHPWLISNQKN
ncbi:MAG: four helix bundle protein [Anaerolineae bacterium]